MRPLDPAEFDIDQAFHVQDAGRHTLRSWESGIRSAIDDGFIRVFRDRFTDDKDLPRERIHTHLDYHRQGQERGRHVKYKISAARYLEDIHHTVETTSYPTHTEQGWIYTGFEIEPEEMNEKARIKKRADVACAHCNTFVECGEIHPRVAGHAFGFERDGEELRRTRHNCVDSFITLPYPHQEQPQGENGQWSFFIFRSLDLPDAA